MNVLDLFSGIGGFSLGLERAGMTTVAFCEIEPFCRAVLRKHWPQVPIYDDVRELTAARLRDDGIGVDVICGGFPCQDISNAGQRAGIDGERSGLWGEYARIVGELRPRFVIVENVAALLGRGIERVLGDLSALGYDAEWHCISAAAVGAPHRRDRVWIIAYPECNELRLEPRWSNWPSWPSASLVAVDGEAQPVADADRPERRPQPERWNVPDRHDARREEAASGLAAHREDGGARIVADAYGARLSFAWSEPLGEDRKQGRGVLAADSWWAIEPDVGRVADGVPFRVDRLRGLGNAVVPQIPEIIGRAIMNAEIV